MSEREAAIPRDRVHVQRFGVATASTETAESTQTDTVTVELNRQTARCEYRPGNTLLQTARPAGLKAPSSCEAGSCGTCIAKVVEGTTRMLNNDPLDEDEVADGLVVTCQALPTSRRVRVVCE